MKKTLSFIGLTLSVSVIMGGCAESSKRASDHPLKTIESLDIDRYLGTWYEIARFPFSIQEGCYATTATYSKLKNGRIGVLNRCLMGSFEGSESVAKGEAWVVNSKTNAELKVSFNFFMGLFGGGDYWVIELAPDYSYSVVSEPKGRYLWILSRTPQMKDEVYSGILERLKADGFQTEFLEKTPQK